MVECGTPQETQDSILAAISVSYATVIDEIIAALRTNSVLPAERIQMQYAGPGFVARWCVNVAWHSKVYLHFGDFGVKALERRFEACGWTLRSRRIDFDFQELTRYHFTLVAL